MIEPRPPNHDQRLPFNPAALPAGPQLRTPLATGYLYLASLFFLVGRGIPAKAQASGTVKTMYDVATWVGKPAVLAAVTFVAYLVGSVLEVRAVTIVRGLRKLRQLRRQGRERSSYWLPYPISGAELMQSSASTLGDYIGDRLPEIPSSRVTTPGELQLRRRGMIKLLDDLPQLRTRLYGANKDLYGDYDRLTAEADLKVNVGVAAILLSCVVAATVEAWWALFSVPMTFLIYRGFLTAQKANDVVVQAIVTEVVKSPKFEAFADAVAELTEKGEDPTSLR